MHRTRRPDARKKLLENRLHDVHRHCLQLQLYKSRTLTIPSHYSDNLADARLLGKLQGTIRGSVAAVSYEGMHKQQLPADQLSKTLQSLSAYKLHKPPSARDRVVVDSSELAPLLYERVPHIDTILKHLGYTSRR